MVVFVTDGETEVQHGLCPSYLTTAQALWLRPQSPAPESIPHTSPAMPRLGTTFFRAPGGLKSLPDERDRPGSTRAVI